MTHTHPFLPALASLEWDINKSFWADDLPPLDFSKLKHLSEEQWSRACFNLDSSVKLIQSDWPIFRIWQISQDWKIPGELNKEIESSEEPSQECLLVYRDGDGEVQVSELTPAAYEALRKIKSGMRLEELFESLESERPSESPTGVQVQSWFQEWIQKGIIREIVLAEL